MTLTPWLAAVIINYPNLDNLGVEVGAKMCAVIGWAGV